MAVVIVQSSIDDDIREAIAGAAVFDGAAVVQLIQGAFEATRNTDLTTLVEADFPGYAEKESTGPVVLYREPITNQWWMVIPELLGGWLWSRTGGAGDPQTIYGVRIQDMGCFLIPPVLVAAEGDMVQIGEIHIPIDEPVLAGQG